MLRTVVAAGCLLVAGVTIGALLVGHQAFFKKSLDGQTKDIGPLDRARRSVIQLLTDGDEIPGHELTKANIPYYFDTAGGAIYTIWGRSQCPNGASLAYQGIIGGGHSAYEGGGSEYICLIEEPVWDKTVSGDSGYSYIYGTEFKAGDALFNMENVIGATLVNQNAVCAVCRTTKTAQVMIPGTNSCMVGWHVEYYGYLMSSKRDSVTQRNYICVDIAPEADRSGVDLEGGSELWPVEAMCGSSLPCPSYEQGKELTCVVCSI